ncbi:conserved hypothetical protein [Pyrenophora tritici-repentis Pt-1C-BFP]|uniref:Uncharacterized protein n=1 Tax=Pyrenophora tritici-repentis (strain Pt-1C-BFP) TaxID=426418 RepID=B2VT53_PYRTR|nr:uncharacterized protein PTRG_01889 [Pyrenophora tritici-repentis Pt-1C-BFP]EDU41327.1 conserved hypothetical protein [Pyrenophora tritici-repentis Pt-1C-BFP]
MPTRLIDLNGQPKLIETAHYDLEEENSRNVTLSHRWTQGCTIKLLHSNIEALKQHIDSATLSTVFRDTLFMAKQFGIFYI